MWTNTDHGNSGAGSFLPCSPQWGYAEFLLLNHTSLNPGAASLSDVLQLPRQLIFPPRPSLMATEALHTQLYFYFLTVALPFHSGVSVTHFPEGCTRGTQDI